MQVYKRNREYRLVESSDEDQGPSMKIMPKSSGKDKHKSDKKKKPKKEKKTAKNASSNDDEDEETVRESVKDTLHLHVKYNQII